MSATCSRLRAHEWQDTSHNMSRDMGALNRTESEGLW
jgi:hypothetical protein